MSKIELIHEKIIFYRKNSLLAYPDLSDFYSRIYGNVRVKPAGQLQNVRRFIRLDGAKN